MHRVIGAGPRGLGLKRSSVLDEQCALGQGILSLWTLCCLNCRVKMMTIEYTCLSAMLWGVDKTKYVRCCAQCLTHSNPVVQESPYFFLSLSHEKHWDQLESLEAALVIWAPRMQPQMVGRADGKRRNNDGQCKTATLCMTRLLRKTKSYFSQNILLSNAKWIWKWKLAVTCSVVFIGLLLDWKTLTPIL